MPGSGFKNRSEYSKTCALTRFSDSLSIRISSPEYIASIVSNTSDPRTKSRGTNYEWSLSVPQIKAAFMDSQAGDKLAVGQGDVLDDNATLDFDEFQECIARCAIAKYRAVKAMKPGACVTGFIANLTNELTTEQVMQDATYIKAERFDIKTAAPIAGHCTIGRACFRHE